LGSDHLTCVKYVVGRVAYAQTELKRSVRRTSSVPRICQMEAMDERSVWETISTAPYDRDIEIAVIETDHVYPLIFACRRTANGWVKASSRERLRIDPTHWRPWQD